MLRIIMNFIIVSLTLVLFSGCAKYYTDDIRSHCLSRAGITSCFSITDDKGRYYNVFDDITVPRSAKKLFYNVTVQNPKGIQYMMLGKEYDGVSETSEELLIYSDSKDMTYVFDCPVVIGQTTYIVVFRLNRGDFLYELIPLTYEYPRESDENGG